MAESVDALVSNTSGAIRPGSTPGLGTSKTTKSLFKLLVVFFLYLLKSAMRHTQDPISAFLADDGYYRRSEKRREYAVDGKA